MSIVEISAFWYLFWIFLYFSAICLFSQTEARCLFYWFDLYKSDLITFYSLNGKIFKVIQAVSVAIWKELELISPVWVCRYSEDKREYAGQMLNKKIGCRTQMQIFCCGQRIFVCHIRPKTFHISLICRYHYKQSFGL